MVSSFVVLAVVISREDAKLNFMHNWLDLFGVVLSEVRIMVGVW